MSQQTNTFSNDNMFPARTIARPIKNLGNTCYMNAVLQALAHAPELCLAMDCEPHHLTCPIAAENYARQHRTASGESSPSSSPDNTTSNNNNNDNAAAAAAASRKTMGTRKSLRSSGRKSPLEDQEETKRRRLQFCALCEVEKHVKKVHDSTLKDKPVAPSTFVDGFIDFVAPWFKPGVQEDSHEFLRLLIDSMQKSCERARVSSSPLSLVQQDNPQDDSPTSVRPPSGGDAASSNGGDDKDSEYPFSLFRGTVESIVTCQSCKAVSSTLDPIEDIGLEVTMPTNSNGGGTSTATTTTTTSMDRSSRNSSPTPAPALADVQTAFQRFARAEPLHGYKCEECGFRGTCTKQSRLASIPPILTLHLKRFRYGTGEASSMIMSSSSSAATGSNNNNNNTTATTTMSSTVTTRRTPRSEVGQLMGSTHSDFKSGSAKIEGNIKFQELFDLKPYLTDELQSQNGNMLCRLFAVIVHAGKNSHSGHYIAYVRSLSKATTKNNEWWKMDDGRVTPASPQEVLRSEAYMLFYRVVQHPVAARLEQEYKIKVAAAAAAAEAAALNNKGPRMNTQELPEGATTEGITVTMQDVVAAVASTSSSVTVPLRRSPRKRQAPPEFETGEDWARKKTKFPPPIIDFLKTLREHGFLSADNVEWNKAFIQNVLDVEASKENARVGKYPYKNRSSISSANVNDLEVGRADALRVQLKRLFKLLSDFIDTQDGIKLLSDFIDTQDGMGTFLSWLTTDGLLLLATGNKKIEEVSTSFSIATTKITSSISTLTGTDEKRVAAVVEPEEEMALL